MAIKEVFTFPNLVNEVSARVVGGGVALMAAATVASRRPWLIAPMAYGFVARTLAGPKFSPLGLVATRVLTPRLPGPQRLIAGPPKRFAQAIGAVCSLSALLLAFVFRRTTAAYTLIAVLGVFATLESACNYCVGCKVFGLLMKLGLVPEAVCAECANIWTRPDADADAAPRPLARGEAV